MRELPFYTNWSYAHPRAIELAAEVASLAPGDLNRVFFVSGGSEAVESAWKLARQYYAARGERRWKAIARQIAYHGTTMGALSINGIPALRTPFEPLVPGGAARAQHEPLPPAAGGDRGASSRAFLLDDLEETILQAGPGDGRHGASWSRCRTRAAPSRRPRATGRACASSATATASCSAPTR